MLDEAPATGVPERKPPRSMCHVKGVNKVGGGMTNSQLGRGMSRLPGTYVPPRHASRARSTDQTRDQQCTCCITHHLLVALE